MRLQNPMVWQGPVPFLRYILLASKYVSNNFNNTVLTFDYSIFHIYCLSFFFFFRHIMCNSDTQGMIESCMALRNFE